MSTRPTPVPSSLPPRDGPSSSGPAPSSSGTRLERIGRALLDVALSVPGPPELVGLAGTDPDDDTLVVATLPDGDPATELLGLTAPPSWWGIGLVTEARSRSLGRHDGGAAASDDRPVGDSRWRPFVHLVARDGSALGLLAEPDGTTTVFGPDDQLSGGRTADACRRVLGLATAPPPDMTSHLVDLWLGLVVREAVQHPGLGWPDVVALHPGRDGLDLVDGPPTPAAMATRTAELGAEVDWERYRLACIDRGSSPFHELEAPAMEWMDAGMFARWLIDEALGWPDQMDLLDALLAPPASERLWATLMRCPAPQWPPR